ncbi:MAG: hypothetical protein BA863_13935 [Desulfovibrio sp. S3730MH75]|nr:MAG: hypothetical protein BA863_13935 [Desulfovibrio sp. S3730MH75]
MKKILYLGVSVLLFVSLGATVFASDEKEAVRDRLKDVLFEYKDAYNLRDFDAIRALYSKDASVMSFPCDSKEDLAFEDFSGILPQCASYWVDQSFKLRLFKFTSFALDGKTCTVRVLWDYRDNSGRGKFTPTFEFVLDGDKWKISKETYGRNPA